MDDLILLAQQARAALAEGCLATLAVAGIGRLDDSATLLHDEGGAPRFVCVPGSRVAEAIGRPAILTVTARPRGSAQATVILSGPLVPAGGEHPGLGGVLVVGMQVHRVVVEQENPVAPTMAQREVPLDVYLQAEPDTLAGYGASMTAHANTAHQAELRQLAAVRAGLPIDRVVGAMLTDLDSFGVSLQWVAPDGGHRRRLCFGAPADSPALLGRLMRELLCGDEPEDDTV